MKQSRPKLKDKKLVITALFLLIFAVIILPASQIAKNYAFAVQLIAILSAAASLFILIKYVLTDYLYTLENGHFTVHKVNGNKSICVADIELSDMISAVLTKEEYKKDDTARKVHSFIKNPDGENLRYIICRFGTDECAILFEPDSLFENELTSQMNEYKNRQTENEDDDDE